MDPYVHLGSRPFVLWLLGFVIQVDRQSKDRCSLFAQIVWQPTRHIATVGRHKFIVFYIRNAQDAAMFTRKDDMRWNGRHTGSAVGCFDGPSVCKNQPVDFAGLRTGLPPPNIGQFHGMTPIDLLIVYRFYNLYIVINMDNKNE